LLLLALSLEGREVLQDHVIIKIKAWWAEHQRY